VDGVHEEGGNGRAHENCNHLVIQEGEEVVLWC